MGCLGHQKLPHQQRAFSEATGNLIEMSVELLYSFSERSFLNGLQSDRRSPRDFMLTILFYRSLHISDPFFSSVL